MSKNSAIDSALAEAAARRAQAAAKHPGISSPGIEIVQDEEDKPVYSARQVERMMQAQATGTLAPSAPANAGSLQTATFDALMREIERRKALAMQKLKEIPTEFLELELQRRKEGGQ